jgi:molybdopterin converting factor small subunit
MRVQVLFFARGRELAGTSQTTVEVEPGTPNVNERGIDATKLMEVSDYILL